MTSAPQRYFRDCRGSVLVRRLDDLTLLYHRPSGMTHLLDSPLPEILDELEEKPQATGTILERLSRAYDLGAAEEASKAGLDDHLQMLVSLGLARVTS